MNTRSKKANVVENDVLNKKGRVIDAENEIRNTSVHDNLRVELALVKTHLLEKELLIEEMSSNLNELQLNIRYISAKLDAQQFVLERLRTDPDEETELLMERMRDNQHQVEQVLQRESERMQELLQRMRRRLVELNTTRQTVGAH